MKIIDAGIAYDSYADAIEYEYWHISFDNITGSTLTGIL